MRGGVSLEKFQAIPKHASSPHAWGCFCKNNKMGLKNEVFPTCVGVFLKKMIGTQTQSCLPHMRGGVSFIIETVENRVRSSPHAWGCFPVARSYVRQRQVFPTCVGVFLSERMNCKIYFSLPHMRGGVSHTVKFQCGFSMSSPHAWGCFYRSQSP